LCIRFANYKSVYRRSLCVLLQKDTLQRFGLVSITLEEEKDHMSSDYTTDKDLGTQGQEDTLKGKMDKTAGKVQKKVGQVTGNKSMEAKGKAREVGGKVEEKGGQLEQNVDNTLKDS